MNMLEDPKKSMLETHNGLEKFLDYYKDFDASVEETLKRVYAKNIVFEDPFHRIEGRDQLHQYFMKMMDNVSECRFDIHLVTTRSPGTGAGKEEALSNAMISWDMVFRHAKLAGNQPVTVNGVTHIRYDSQVVFHRDFFDSSQLIYKNIPVVGSVIKFLEKRM